MRKTKVFNRLWSIILCMTLLAGCMPMSAMEVAAEERAATPSVVVDPGTADTWETMLGTDGGNEDGNRYAGRVWVDKSVYKEGDTVLLNTKNETGSSFAVTLEDDEAFQVVFSALGSSMTTTETSTTTGPMDVVLILDTSTSMDDTVNNVTRLQRVIEAANELIDDLLAVDNMRIAIVTYNKDSETLLSLDDYSNGITLKVTDYYNNGSSDAGVVFAYDDDNSLLGKDSGYTMGTNLQSGIDRGFNILANAQNVEGRIPVAIVLTDGQANRATQERFYEVNTANDSDGTSASDERLYLSTMLNAAYSKTKVEAHYGTEQKVYSVSVDLDENSTAHVLMNPSDSENGFNAQNSNEYIRDAYTAFLRWSQGRTVTLGNNNTWTFDHDYPTQNGAVTRQKIAANINYVSKDSHYDVSSADLKIAFEQIYKELTSGVFNPISSSNTAVGGTGVEDTPLIYVDFIGEHMEIKQMQAVTLFGGSYGITKGTAYTKTENNETVTVTPYTVVSAGVTSPGTGQNPATNENWNVSEDIMISVIEGADGSQKLEIKINQEILPIIFEKVLSETVAGNTTATITEIMQSPVRVYYTVGLSEDILLENGEIDISKLTNYTYLDTDNANATFYSNQFGVMNPAENNVVTMGDAHVGFQPSEANRYYYHQANQGIFSAATNADGSAVAWEDDMYGVEYDNPEDFRLTYMSYDDYLNFTDNKQVYTYVTFYRPTGTGNEAEEVTYLVYTDWGYLKESVAFYDHDAGVFINANGSNGYTTGDVGYAIPTENVQSVINAYKAENPKADIKAMLGVGSLRTSRFHNMMREKDSNNTLTATLSYDPEYTYDTADEHNGNSVIVWLGNNGKLTMPLDVETGIALTKNVTEPIGNPTDTYELTVTVPNGVKADPVVKDASGNIIGTADASDNDAVAYAANVLTVKVKAGETVYITGIPGGTECEIGETIAAGAEYYISEKTDEVTVPTVKAVLEGENAFAAASVTNAPVKTGNLFITKEITGTGPIPDSIVNDSVFSITVESKELADKTYEYDDGDSEDGDTTTSSAKTITFDADGKATLSIKTHQTIEILDLPAGTNITVTENLISDQDKIFTVSYRTLNSSGTTADSDNVVTIPTNANATAVITNTYTPLAVTVDLDIDGKKELITEGNHDSLEFTFKVQKWDDDSKVWTDISNKTAMVNYATLSSGNLSTVSSGNLTTEMKQFTIEDVLAGETYTSVGSWAYQVLEVKGNDSNITYDRTLYTFTVTVEDNGGQLVAKVTDLNGVEITDGSYDVTFENTYHTAPVSIDIVKEVENNSDDLTVSKAGFKFKAVRTDESWKTLTGAAASELTVTSDAAGEARVTATYTAAGKYHYKLTEEPGAAGNGWTCSNAEYHVTVDVTEQDGNLTATMTIVNASSPTDSDETATVVGSTGTVVFKNTYDPQDAIVDLNAKVKKTIEDKDTLTKAGYTFKVYRNGTDEVVLTGTSADNGDVTFDKTLTFSQVGKYEYDINEVVPEGATLDSVSGKYVLDGVYYDPTVYDLVVQVTNDKEHGKLVATAYFEDATTDVVTFKNVYKPAATSYTLRGTKALYGRTLKAGEFEFELYQVNDENSTLVETVKNDINGNFMFTTLSFTSADNYTYIIKEKTDNTTGIAYDTTEYQVTIAVIDSNGVLTAAPTITSPANATEIKFVNNYVEYTLGGTKELKNRALKAGEFTFELYEGNNKISEVTNKADGSFAFPVITYTAEGTYTYTIKETVPAVKIPGVTYDTDEKIVTVTVAKDSDGKMTATANVQNSDIKFTNTYTAAPVKVTFNANKTLVGTTDEQFKFDLYQTNNTFAVSGTPIATSGEKTVSGTEIVLSDEITFSSTGTYYYTIVEDISSMADDIVYDRTQHNYAVIVTDDGTGYLKATVIYVNTGASVVGTSAITAPVANFKNATFDEATEKEVYLSANTQTEIDGQKVNAGEILTYFITYTNYTGADVVVDIMDTIPKYTSYVEGSAKVVDSNEVGTYVGTHVNWILNVVKDATVKVYFSVKVDETEAIVANQAIVRDGVNTYTTNEVKNHTVEEPADKDVFYPDDTTVTIDGKKVYAGDELLYTVSYTNATDASVNVKITDAIPKYTTYVEGSADNGGICSDGKLTWEITDVAAWSTVKVSFKVKVDDGVEAVAIKNQATVVEGNNTYTTNEVKNHTVKDEVEKDVFSSGKPNISIDGKKVSVGDELIYKISYKNTDTEPAKVTITDQLPVGVTYVQNSADNGGAYASGVLTWKDLNVNAGETITVSFKAKVNDVYAAEIANEAQVTEGKNTYTTDKTVNQKNNEIEVVIPIQKKLTTTGNIGHTLGGFEFRLKNVTQDVTYKAVTSDNHGQTKYVLKFNANDMGKTYEYELVEIDKDAKHMTYDTNVHKLSIEITVDADGKMVANIKQNGKAVKEAGVSFNNTYSGNKQVPDSPKDPVEIVYADGGTPPTGDNANTIGFVVLAIAAVLGLGGLTIYKRKRR